MTTSAKELLQRKLEGLESMPTLPVTLIPLLRYLEQPMDTLDVQEIVDLISKDKALSAQCLQMANSPLFGRWQAVDSIRGAVVALGIQRMRDIAVSCSVLTLLPEQKGVIDPTVFWEHSFGCALVSRQFAQRIKYPHPEKAYLGGLLHDIGIVAHIWVVPREFNVTMEMARSNHIPLHEAELATLGTTHCHTGKLVCGQWRMTSDLITVAGCHHDLSEAKEHRVLTALVALSDLLCRMGGLGYGYAEDREVDFLEEPAFEILLEECPELKKFDWARFTFELGAYMEEVHRLVALLYRAT